MLDQFALSQAFGLLFSSFDPWIWVIPGLLIGLVFGSIPGLQISMPGEDQHKGFRDAPVLITE